MTIRDTEIDALQIAVKAILNQPSATTIANIKIILKNQADTMIQEEDSRGNSDSHRRGVGAQLLILVS